jgi:hypothetical protein
LDEYFEIPGELETITMCLGSLGETAQQAGLSNREINVFLLMI